MLEAIWGAVRDAMAREAEYAAAVMTLTNFILKG
jgi:hypothetical protein